MYVQCFHVFTQKREISIHVYWRVKNLTWRVSLSGWPVQWWCSICRRHQWMAPEVLSFRHGFISLYNKRYFDCLFHFHHLCTWPIFTKRGFLDHFHHLLGRRFLLLDQVFGHGRWVNWSFPTLLLMRRGIPNRVLTWYSNMPVPYVESSCIWIITLWIQCDTNIKTESNNSV